MIHNFITVKAKHERLIENVFPKIHSDIIDLAFKHGGYIAGGSAITLARYDNALDTLDTDGSNEAMINWQNEFHSCYWTVEEYVYDKDVYNRLKLIMKRLGDIDVWFKTQEGYDNFNNELCKITQNNNKIFKSDSKYAVNILPINLVDKVTDSGYSYMKKFEASCKIQAINKNFGSVQDIMNNFDIVNSMIAYDGTSFTFVEHWKEIDKNRELRVNIESFTSETINRLSKYITKKGFNTITEEISNIVKDEIVKTIDWIDQVGINLIERSDIDLNKLSVLQLQMLLYVTKDDHHLEEIDNQGIIITPLNSILPEKSQQQQKAEVVNMFLDTQKTLIKKMTTSDVLELSAYQYDRERSEESNYNFIKHTLIQRLQDRMRED